MRDRPLRRGGVLHFIQQQVVETAVQLVEHPGGAGIDQQGGTAADQVFIVHQPGIGFAPRIGLQNRCGQRDQGRRDERHGKRADLVIDRAHALGFIHEWRKQFGARLGKLGIEEGAGLARVPVRGDELLAPVLPKLLPFGRGQAEPAQDAPGPLGNAGGAGIAHAFGCFQQVALARPLHGGRTDRVVGVRADAKRAALRGAKHRPQFQRPGQPGPIGFKCNHVAAELFGRDKTRKRAQRLLHGRRVGTRQHGLARLGHGVFGVAVVDELEVRRQGRFQRKAPQQRLAEGVDRADTHPAGQVEHVGKQRTRLAPRRIGQRDIETG